jgi:hypothetical protein
VKIFQLHVYTPKAFLKAAWEAVHPSKEFKDLVADETVNLTHEFILSKLWDEFTKGTHWTAPRRGVLLELDKEMKDFADRIHKET